MLSLLCCGSGYRYGTVGFLARELLHAPGEAKKKKKEKEKSPEYPRRLESSLFIRAKWQ